MKNSNINFRGRMDQTKISRPKYVNSEQFRPGTLGFNPPKGISAEEGRRSRKAKRINGTWRNFFHPNFGCPAAMTCVLLDECGPDGFVKDSLRKKVHHGGRGILRTCRMQYDGASHGFCCR